MAGVSLGKMFQIGCGDNSCMWGSRGGMATNGGCRCYKDIYHHEIENDKKREEARMASMQAKMNLSHGIRVLRDLAELPNVEMALKELVKRAIDQHELMKTYGDQGAK